MSNDLITRGNISHPESGRRVGPIVIGQKTTACRRKTAQQRKQELIDAGIVGLGKSGISAFTIDQICKQAGGLRGLINHNFRSRDDQDCYRLLRGQGVGADVYHPARNAEA